MNIGFIGLGIMGKPMARNLLRAGHSLYVSNRSQASVDALVQDGAIAASYPYMAEKCPLILTMLPDSPDVYDVMLGDHGIGPYLQKGQTVIDMSSINPRMSQTIASALAEHGVEMLDAPVSGGEPKAIDGTLSFMVGGKQEIFTRYQSILASMGTSIVYCGPIGSGNTTKLINQIIVALNIAAVSEGLMLAEQSHADLQTVYTAIRNGLAGSAVLDAKAPMMIARQYPPGFKIDLHIKDLRNALDLAHQVGAPTPLTRAVMDMLQTLHADGFGQCDHSALFHYYENDLNKGEALADG